MKPRNLDHLKTGESATIKAVNAGKGLIERLAALGFRSGKKIEIIRRASFNGPLQVRIGSTDIILRGSEAHLIQVQDLSH